MFTGIIQTKASVISTNLNGGVLRLVLSVGSEYLQRLDLGASIAINGCCLTVVSYELNPQDVVVQVVFDVIEETLKLTNLGELKRGMFVNLERSVTFGTELGGHIVSGHIHCTTEIEDIVLSGNNCKILLDLPKAWLKYIVYKGFGKFDKPGLARLARFAPSNLVMMPRIAPPAKIRSVPMKLLTTNFFTWSPLLSPSSPSSPSSPPSSPSSPFSPPPSSPASSAACNACSNPMHGSI